MKTIQEAFAALDIYIQPQDLIAFERTLIHFEIRGAHPLTLNSQMIGVHPVVFTSADRQALFQIFRTTEADVAHASRSAPFINQTFKVVSDPFNLFCIWLVHLSFTQISDEKARHDFAVGIIKYLHYKFFTSLVNHDLRHGADESVMLAAVNSLNRKFDLIVYGTWKKMIEARSEDVVSIQSIHHDALVTATDDKAVLYVISDTQTRIRDKINNICDVYYDFHKRGVKIASSAATTTDLDGEKILVQKAQTFDAMVTDLVTSVVNVNTFIDMHVITQVSAEFSSTSRDLLKVTLIRMSETASRQVMTGHFDDEIKEKGQLIHVGIKALISAVVLVSFRYCVNNKIPLKNKAAVWIKLRDMYSSSRVNDADVIAIKTSVGMFIDSIGETSREATKSSLRLAVIMYLIYRCLKYL